MSKVTAPIRLKHDLPPWPRYEADPSFRKWIDMCGSAPEYTLAWFLQPDSAAL